MSFLYPQNLVELLWPILKAMVRPRVGDFVYSPEELDVMYEDICAFAELGVTGVVLGVLQVDGSVDVQNTKMLTEKAVTRGLQGGFLLILYAVDSEC